MELGILELQSEGLAARLPIKQARARESSVLLSQYLHNVLSIETYPCGQDCCVFPRRKIFASAKVFSLQGMSAITPSLECIQCQCLVEPHVLPLWPCSGFLGFRGRCCSVKEVLCRLFSNLHNAFPTNIEALNKSN